MATTGGRDAAHSPSRIALNKRVEARRDQHSLQSVVEHVSRRARHLRPRNQHVRLPFPLPSKRHPPPAFLVGWPANQTAADFVNGLLRPAASRAAANLENFSAHGEPSRFKVLRAAKVRLPAMGVRRERRRFPVGARPARQPLQPEATGAVMEGTKWLKPSV